jgi:hypothetical protein
MNMIDLLAVGEKVGRSTRQLVMAVSGVDNATNDICVSLRFLEEMTRLLYVFRAVQIHLLHEC